MSVRDGSPWERASRRAAGRVDDAATRRPSTRRTRRAVAAGAAALSLGIVSWLGAASGAQAQASAADPTAEFVSLINGYRSARGIAVLRVDPELSTIAAQWAQQMSRVQRCADGVVLAHNPAFVPADGRMPADLARRWRLLTENVGCADPADVQLLHNGFLASPHHLDNIVDQRVDSMGIGVFVDPDGVLWVVQDYGDSDPLPAPATPPAAARATPTVRGAAAVPKRARTRRKPAGSRTR